jgi:hypothetical protein
MGLVPPTDINIQPLADMIILNTIQRESSMRTYRLEKIEQGLRFFTSSTEEFLVFNVIGDNDRQMGAQCDGI